MVEIKRACGTCKGSLKIPCPVHGEHVCPACVGEICFGAPNPKCVLDEAEK